MLAAAGQTRRADLHRAVERLDQVGATILGIVLNKVTRQTRALLRVRVWLQALLDEGAAVPRGEHLNGSGKVQSHRLR